MTAVILLAALWGGLVGVGSLEAQETPPRQALSALQGGPVSAAPAPLTPADHPLRATWTGPRARLRHLFAYRGETGAHALQGAVGLLAASGGPIPASPSTAGQRMEGSPRWVLDLGTGFVRANLPANRGAADADHDRSALLLAPRATLAAGIFQGVSPSPTVGGMGSLDLVGELRLLPVFAPDGVSGASVAWGVGARIGVVRESFTLPGLTLVAMHRRAGATVSEGPLVTLPLEDEGTTLTLREVVEVKPSISSLRAVAGKDLMQIGVSAGVQWDRIRGDARVWVLEDADAEAARTAGTTPTSMPLPMDRTTWFVGLNRTWVVTQVSLELGWSPAADAPEEPGSTGFPAYRGADGALSGALSFRITY
jgi:hypothetical protein